MLANVSLAEFQWNLDDLAPWNGGEAETSIRVSMYVQRGQWASVFSSLPGATQT
jgi:hypothetical protein